MHNYRDVIKASRANTKSRNYKYAGDDAAKIISEYFKAAETAVLCGQEWKFPKGFGTLKIVCREAENSSKIKDFVYRKGKGYKRKIAYNFKRFNLIYTFLLQSSFLEEQLYEFKASAAMRAKLYRVLTQTNFNYQQQ